MIKNNEVEITYDPKKQKVRFGNIAPLLIIRDQKMADLYKLQDIQGLWLEHQQGIHIVNTDNGSVNTDNDSFSLLAKIGIGVCVVTVFAAIGGGTALYINKSPEMQEASKKIKEMNTIGADDNLEQTLDLS